MTQGRIAQKARAKLAGWLPGRRLAVPWAGHAEKTVISAPAEIQQTITEPSSPQRRGARVLILPSVTFGKNDFSESISAALKKRYWLHHSASKIDSSTAPYRACALTVMFSPFRATAVVTRYSKI
jgi:hypothetical protein